MAEESKENVRFAKAAFSIRLSSGKYSCATWCNQCYPSARDRDNPNGHRPNHPIAHAGGREMHNALTEGNGIAKHTACCYGNVNPPQVAFLSALCPLTNTCIPFLFYSYALRCSIMYAKVCVATTPSQNIYRFRKLCNILSIPSVLFFFITLQIRVLNHYHLFWRKENIWLRR